MRSTCSQGVLNKWLKRNLHQLKQFCAESGFEMLRVKSVEISLMAIYLQLNVINLSRSRLFTSYEIHIITNYLHLNCREYGKKHLIQIKSAWPNAIHWNSLLTWETVRDEIRVLTIDIHLICSEYGFKHNLHKERNLYIYAWLTFHGLETRFENSDELIALQLEMQLIGNQKSLRTCVRPTEEVRVLTLDLQPISSVYEFDTRLALSIKISVYRTHI